MVTDLDLGIRGQAKNPRPHLCSGSSICSLALCLCFLCVFGKKSGELFLFRSTAVGLLRPEFEGLKLFLFWSIVVGLLRPKASGVLVCIPDSNFLV